MSRNEEEQVVSVISVISGSLRIWQWKLISKILIINCQNIINIPECEIKYFGFCNHSSVFCSFFFFFCRTLFHNEFVSWEDFISWKTCVRSKFVIFNKQYVIFNQKKVCYNIAFRPCQTAGLPHTYYWTFYEWSSSCGYDKLKNHMSAVINKETFSCPILKWRIFCSHFCWFVIDIVLYFILLFKITIHWQLLVVCDMSRANSRMCLSTTPDFSTCETYVWWLLALLV